jgi:hypothetical protein
MTRTNLRRRIVLALGGLTLAAGTVVNPSRAQGAGGAPAAQGFQPAAGRCLGDYQSAPRAQDGDTCAKCGPTTGSGKNTDKRTGQLNRIIEVTPSGGEFRRYSSGVMTAIVVTDLPGSSNACLEAHTGEIGQNAGLGGCGGVIGAPPPGTTPPPSGTQPSSNGPGP